MVSVCGVELLQSVELTKLLPDSFGYAEEGAQLYARADNLRNYLADVETRLGSLSQRLSASVGQARFNTDLAGDPAANQSTIGVSERVIKTPWLEIDDVFYEARGAAWALLHILRAIERDFGSVLENKNARVSLKQVIRELEATQNCLVADDLKRVWIRSFCQPFVGDGELYRQSARSHF